MNDKKKEHSLGDKIKEGVSVQEIEKLARKYTTEAFLILAILIGTISSIFDFFTGPGWSLVFAGIGAVVSLAFPKNIMNLQKKFMKLVLKQEKSAQIAIGIGRLVVALFLPFILFGELGLLAGCSFHLFNKQLQSESPLEAPEKKESSSESEEEHL